MSLFANARTLPDGSWIMCFTFPQGHTTVWLGKIGSYPPASSVNRANYIPVPVQLPAKSGAVKAVIDYGFDENLRCTNRTDGCVATGALPTDPNPFYWASESYSGAACSSGCTIKIPAIGGRMVYYRPRYLDASGATVLTGKMAVVAVP
jgi:hypothetical protein